MSKLPHVENPWKTERERLASELQRLEEALSDARSGSGDDEDGSLVSRLMDATRKRVRIEEEFERSSDRWREERRSLTEEIDQLDRALARARADAHRSQSVEPREETSGLRQKFDEARQACQRAEETLGQERAEWADARNELESRIGGLEARLVEALERANNDSRRNERSSTWRFTA